MQQPTSYKKLHMQQQLQCNYEDLDWHIQGAASHYKRSTTAEGYLVNSIVGNAWGSEKLSDDSRVPVP
jgi:hypothetical protein